MTWQHLIGYLMMWRKLVGSWDNAREESTSKCASLMEADVVQYGASDRFRRTSTQSECVHVLGACEIRDRRISSSSAQNDPDRPMGLGG